VPVTIHTPREDLICGVLDQLAERCASDLGALYLIEQARSMASRMEAKLFERKHAADTHRCPSSFDLWVAEQEASIAKTMGANHG
jgi:hypothetical protein